MKLAFLVLAAAINPVFAADPVPTNSLPPFELWLASPAVSTQHQGWMFPGDFGTNGNGLPLTLTNLPALNFKADKAPFDGKRSLQDHLKPGVYKTSPYTCLVLIPGPQPDDCSVHGPGVTGVERMPTIKPELKFIPQPLAEK
ncbi:MAG: hypothetical protein ACLPYZ_17890 [Limisphaerales bacterium]